MKLAILFNNVHNFGIPTNQNTNDNNPKTVFNTENGWYEFSRIPFGLKNASEIFQ
jgi:hypothetical protein